MGQSRNEDCLENILGAENVLLPPMSRNEKILHAILGEDIPLDEPQSRIEELLMQIKEQGIGGGLTPYATTRDFTLTVKNSSPYNFVDLTTEERNLFVDAKKSIVVASFNIGTTDYRWFCLANVSGNSDSNMLYFYPQNGESLLSGNCLGLRVKAKTSPYGIAATQATVDGVSKTEITVKIEFYSIESIL